MEKDSGLANGWGDWSWAFKWNSFGEPSQQVKLEGERYLEPAACLIKT